MKKRFLKKSFAVLVAFGVFVNLAFLPANSVWAADEFIFSADNGHVEPSKNPVGIFELADLCFSHDGEIEVNSVPSKKEAIVLFDSSYESTKTESPFISALEHALFSRSNAEYRGNNIKIVGDVFTQDNIIIDASPIDVTGQNKYSNRKGSWTGPAGNELILVDGPENDDGKYEKNDRKYYDYLFGADGNITTMLETMTSAIEDEIDISKYGAQIRFEEGNRHKYFGLAPNYADTFKYGADKENDLNIRYTIDNDPRKVFPYQKSKYEIFGEGAFRIEENMYFEGSLKITVGGGITSELDKTPKFIYAEGDIQLQGGSLKGKAIENIYLFSGNGSIDIQTGTSDFKGFAIAPKGAITLNGQEDITITGSFIGNKLVVQPSGATFHGPTEEMLDPFTPYIKETKGFDAVKEAIHFLPDLFDEYTRAGVITYSDYADINELDIVGIDEDDPGKENWQLYDISSEKNELKTYINTLKADVSTKKSNLGDAMRRALGIFDSDICDPEAEKFLIIFTSLDPNAYTSGSGVGNFELDLNKDVNKDQISSESGTKGNDYVERFSSIINDYNDSTDGGQIHKILVDLSLFRQQANDNEEIIDPLDALAGNLGIEPKYCCRPSKADMDNYSAVDESFIYDLAKFSNEMPPKLAVENLTISSAELELSLPSYLKPVKLFFKTAEGKEEIIADLSSLTLSGELYDIRHTFSGDELAALSTVDGGLNYDFTASELYLSFVTNNSDTFTENTLSINGKVNTAGPKITYKLFEDKNGDGIKSDSEKAVDDVVVPFDNIKFDVIYEKDIN